MSVWVRAAECSHLRFWSNGSSEICNRYRPTARPAAARLGRSFDPLALARTLRYGAASLRLVGDRDEQAAEVPRHGPRTAVLAKRSFNRDPLGPAGPEAPFLFFFLSSRIPSFMTGRAGLPSIKVSHAQPHAFGSVRDKRQSVRTNLLINLKDLYLTP